MLKKSKEIFLDDPVGHVLHINFGTDEFIHTYYSEDRMKWESVAGEEKGLWAEENYLKREIAPGIHMISWQETTGTVVTLVLNLNTMKTNAISAFPVDGTNRRWVLDGDIKIIK